MMAPRDGRVPHRPRLLAAPDKFRGTASARDLADAAAAAARRSGWSAVALPLADGGDGLLDAVGGEPRYHTVTGPLGRLVSAEWRLVREPGRSPTAVIEMARASGLALAGGRAKNDPMRATTRGTGELILEALRQGVGRIVVGCGGSATTDGGEGMLAVVRPGDLAGVELVGACDVSTRFLDAAVVFGPQKGARPEQVARLSRRLGDLAARYEAEFGLDVTTIDRAGAAGGLGGALAVLGAHLVSGFTLVADLVGFSPALEEADLVLTGEGRLDATSLEGKVVGEVLRRATGKAPVLVVVGVADPGLALEERYPGATLVSLTERFGRQRAFAEPVALVGEVVTAILDRAPGGAVPRAGGDA